MNEYQPISRREAKILLESILWKYIQSITALLTVLFDHAPITALHSRLSDFSGFYILRGLPLASEW